MNNINISIRSAARYVLLGLMVVVLFMTTLPVVAQGPEQAGELPRGITKRAFQEAETVTVGRGGQAQWTFMVYLDGDNDLEGAGIDDFLEMATLGSSTNVNIIVQFDRINGYNNSYGDWTTTKRYRVTAGMTPTTANALSDIGEVNMGDPNTLVNFVNWAKTNYPASNYALVLWNHGSGWKRKPPEWPLKAVCIDLTSWDELTMSELRSALNTITSGGSNPIHLLAFDACLMAMIEVDYQVQPYAQVRTGSEEVEPGEGYPYDTILADLTAHPSWNATQLGYDIVDEYYASYGNDMTHSAVTLSGSGYTGLVNNVNTFAQVLINYMGTYSSTYTTVRAATQEFDDPTFVDLYDFAQRINVAISEPAINNAATAVMNSVTSVVIRERHGTAWPGAHGISIYFPRTSSSYEDRYASELVFTQGTQWDEFLEAYLASQGEPTGNVYLPIVLKNYCSPTQVVQNGGFESGNTKWVQQSGAYPIISQVYPYSGSWSAYFADYNNANDRLYQAIAMPSACSCSAQLRLYLYVDTEDDLFEPYDYWHAELQNSSGGTLQSFLWADNTMDGGWWIGTVNWSNFASHAGQTRRLFFQGTNDVSYPTAFFVDDVTLWVYCGSLPAGAGELTGLSEGWTWEKVESPPTSGPFQMEGERRQ